MPEDDLSTGESESTLVESIGGMYDAWGTKRRLARKQIINLRGMFELSDNGFFDNDVNAYLIDHLGNFIVDHLLNRFIVDSAAGSMRFNRDQLAAQEGTLQALYRRREDDGLIEWKMARLKKVGQIRTIDDAGAVARIDMIFETRYATWRNNTQTVITQNLPAALVATNQGDVTITDAVLVIGATGTITSITITGAGINLSWTGTLYPGNQLLFAMATQTITIGGVDAYTGFVRGVGHTVPGWIPVTVGDNVLTVTANAPGWATLSFYEQRF